MPTAVNIIKCLVDRGEFHPFGMNEKNQYCHIEFTENFLPKLNYGRFAPAPSQGRLAQ